MCCLLFVLCSLSALNIPLPEPLCMGLQIPVSFDCVFLSEVSRDEGGIERIKNTDIHRAYIYISFAMYVR